MMDDRRWREVAIRLADGIGMSSGSKLAVFINDPHPMPLACALVEEAYGRGATPQVILADERFDQAALDHATLDVLSAPAPLQLMAMQWADVHVDLRALVPPRPSTAGAPRRALLRQAHGVVSDLRWRDTAWAIVRSPTPEWAAMIGKPYDLLLEEFFQGCLGDRAALRRSGEVMAHRLSSVKTIRILAPDTDLSMIVAERRWIVFAGERNLPDGEIATAPIEDSADGFITFPGRFWFSGAEFEDLRLEFRNGSVSRVEARRGEDLARALIGSDDGAARIGEFGIGISSATRTLTGDLFTDEKVAGTVHIALGRAYPECGGSNSSVLHWDLVKDLRPGARGAGDLVSDRDVILHRGAFGPEYDDGYREAIDT